MLFLDEPTTGLDPEARADMWAELESMARAEAMTVLLTTHYLEEADRIAARLAIVDRGRIVVEGTPGELKDSLHGDAVTVELAQPARDGTRARAVLAGVAVASATVSRPSLDDVYLRHTGRSYSPGSAAGAAVSGAAAGGAEVSA